MACQVFINHSLVQLKISLNSGVCQLCNEIIPCSICYAMHDHVRDFLIIQCFNIREDLSKLRGIVRRKADTLIDENSLLRYLYFNSPNCSYSIALLFPFRYPMKLDTLIFGGISTSMCM